MNLDENKYSRAVQLMDIKRYSEARKLLLEILVDQPEDSDVLSFIAITYLVENMSTTAKDFALRAVQSDPDIGRNHHILGLAYLKTDNFELAFDHNKRSLDLEPENTDFLVALVKIRISQDYFAEANEVLDRILEIEPNHVEALGLRSIVKKQMLGSKAGIEDLEYALSLDPTNIFLLKQQADAFIQSGEFDQARDILDQLVANDSGEWLLRESLIDSYMAQYTWYKWLVMKLRAFHVGLSYVTIVFDFTLIILGVGLFIKSDPGAEFYMAYKYLVITALLWNLSFWVARIIGHTWFKLSKWKMAIKDVFDFSLYLHLAVGMTQIMGLIYVFKQDFFYFAFAVVASLLTLASSGKLIIENPKKQRYYYYYLIYLHILSGAILIWSFIDSKITDKLGTAFLGSIFIPLILFSLYDDYKEFKAKKSISKSIEKKPKQNRKRSIPEKLVLWGLGPSYLLCQSLCLVYGASIINKVEFALIWIGLGILFGYLSLRYLKKNNHSFVDVNNTMMKNEEVGGMQVLVWLLSILTVVSLGIAITAFVKVGPINIVSVEVVEHGSNLEKRKTQIKIKYNGYNKSIRPDIDQRLSTKDSKSIKMKVRKSLFGIEYVDEVTHEE